MLKGMDVHISPSGLIGQFGLAEEIRSGLWRSQVHQIKRDFHLGFRDQFLPEIKLIVVEFRRIVGVCRDFVISFFIGAIDTNQLVEKPKLNVFTVDNFH